MSGLAGDRLDAGALAVHLDTITYPVADMLPGVVWTSTATHLEQPLLRLSLVQVLEPNGCGEMAEIEALLGHAAAQAVGQTLCFTEVDPRDLILAAVEVFDQRPDHRLLTTYAAQQAVWSLGAPALHALDEIVGEQGFLGAEDREWGCGWTLTRDAALKADVEIEEALVISRRGLRLL